jgi:2-oxoglutarate dehydrogenase E1 component
VRTIPVKVLEENRRIANRQQVRVSGPRISFTHVIAWAVVRALEKHPALNTGYVEIDGVPHRVRRAGVHLGIAVDAERKGERTLVVPNVRDAQALDFPSFVALRRSRQRARQGKPARGFRGDDRDPDEPRHAGTSLRAA